MRQERELALYPTFIVVKQVILRSEATLVGMTYSQFKSVIDCTYCR